MDGLKVSNLEELEDGSVSYEVEITDSYIENVAGRLGIDPNELTERDVQEQITEDVAEYVAQKRME